MWLTEGKKDPIGQHSKGSNNQMEKQKKLRKKISIGTTSKGNRIQSDNRAKEPRINWMTKAKVLIHWTPKGQETKGQMG